MISMIISMIIATTLTKIEQNLIIKYYYRS